MVPELFSERKRRAIPTSSFGQALTALLHTSTPASKPRIAAGSSRKHPGSEDAVDLDAAGPSSSAPSSAPALLSLQKPSAARKRQKEEKAEVKARKAVLGERKEREDRNRVTDAIGGWGAESERALRKVAQRGGVNLVLFCMFHPITPAAAILPNQSLNCSMSFNKLSSLERRRRRMLSLLAGRGKPHCPRRLPRILGTRGRVRASRSKTILLEGESLVRS
jgi:hypothetical protein